MDSDDKAKADKSRNAVENKGERAQWSTGLQFLMSCIAFSVGLGNIWRFPYTAYENGGGAFIIPYLVVLFIIGKPCYYMEMILGQFSSKSSVKIWSVSPGFKGIGYGVTVSVFSVLTYYSALVAIAIYYLVASCQSDLPWATCREEWEPECYDFSTIGNLSANTSVSSSAELYFLKVVLNETEDINNGLGTPSWKLVICLAASWITVYLVLWRGVKSTGKASYFLALFPYAILIALLIRAVTLPGAVNGIIFLYKPAWEKILEPSVWYAAVTQAFFSLGVCFGAVIMYSSYNDFRHNVYRDCTIVTTLDLFTSLIAATTIFGILGNLAYELGSDDISSVVRSGTGLAFISYPQALAQFTFAPQLFAVLFFFMLYVLGVGTLAAFSNAVISVIADQFPHVPHWRIALGVCLAGFLVGITYCTPGGQYILNLVDHFGGTFIIVVLASFQVVAISWIYGVENFADDVEFMVGKRPSCYWRLCWGFLTPLLLFVIFVYFCWNMPALTYNDQEYPISALVVGWTLLFFGVVQFPVWAMISKYQDKNNPWSNIFKPSEDWGPSEPTLKAEWKNFRASKQSTELEASVVRKRCLC